jgi:polysaccharide export outer membrane protein
MNRKRRNLAMAMLLVGALAPSPAAAEEAPGASAAPAEYRIGPPDVLYVSVWKNDSISRSVTVRPDGNISLPLVNDIRAAGLTPMQLRDAIRRKLADFIPKPEVSVIVTGMHSYAVSVLGEVKAAGRYELKSAATVLDVLAQAGGITEFARRDGIFVLRNGSGGVRRISFDYDKVIASPGQRNVAVQPGDIVVVP